MILVLNVLFLSITLESVKMQIVGTDPKNFI